MINRYLYRLECYTLEEMEFAWQTIFICVFFFVLFFNFMVSTFTFLQLLKSVVSLYYYFLLLLLLHLFPLFQKKPNKKKNTANGKHTSQTCICYFSSASNHFSSQTQKKKNKKCTRNKKKNKTQTKTKHKTGSVASALSIKLQAHPILPSPPQITTINLSLCWYNSIHKFQNRIQNHHHSKQTHKYKTHKHTQNVPFPSFVAVSIPLLS